MIIRILLFIFYLLHLDFLIRYVIFNTTSAEFFGFHLSFDFSKSEVITGFTFSLIFISAFFAGFILPKFLIKKERDFSGYYNKSSIRFLVGFYEMTLVIPILYILISILNNGFSYGDLTSQRATSGFLLELRIIPLILLSYFVLNFPRSILFKSKLFKRGAVLLAVYITLIIIYQVRSLLFELAMIFTFILVKKYNDQFKLKYIILAPFTILIPNLIILHRLGYPKYEIGDLFSFEYSIILNKFFITAIHYREYFVEQISNFNQLLLLIPSPIRSILDIDATQNTFFNDFSSFSGVSGGGFSLLAQLYLSYGYYAILVLFVIGFFLGFFRLKMLRSNTIIFYSATPLLYCAFILSLRNDFIVLIKYGIQLLIIALTIELIDKSFKRIKPNENFTYRPVNR